MARGIVQHYGCHICTDAKAQSNPANVRLHFLSNHNSEFKVLPSIQTMIEAAQSNESKRETPKKISKPWNRTATNATSSEVRLNRENR